MPIPADRRNARKTARRGISLMEILISVFVLSIGLLGVLAIIPIGQYALSETNKADFSGACGRAALREVRVRNLLNPNRMWPQWNLGDSQVFAIDPLGVLSNRGEPFGYMQGLNPGVVLRRTLMRPPQLGNLPITKPMAEAIFEGRDDLSFDRPDDPNQRPRILANTGLMNMGEYTWFVTVAPMLNENNLPLAQRHYRVAAAVCFQRKRADLTSQEKGMPGQPDKLLEYRELLGEQVLRVRPGTAGFPGQGIGGGTLLLETPDPNLGETPLRVRNNEWVMLVRRNNQLNQAIDLQWYRVVGQGTDDANTSTINLAGPDWLPTTNANFQDLLVVVDGVVGVYMTTVDAAALQ